jgi:hypothetical protein
LYDFFDPFHKGFYIHHNYAVAVKALNLKIRACPDNLPLVISTGMFFSGLHNITQADFFNQAAHAYHPFSLLAHAAKAYKKNSAKTNKPSA